MKLHSVVRTKVEKEGVPIGSTGTIVHETAVGYLVEFEDIEEERGEMVIVGYYEKELEYVSS